MKNLISLSAVILLSFFSLYAQEVKDPDFTLDKSNELLFFSDKLDSLETFAINKSLMSNLKGYKELLSPPYEKMVIVDYFSDAQINDKHYYVYWLIKDGSLYVGKIGAHNKQKDAQDIFANFTGGKFSTSFVVPLPAQRYINPVIMPATWVDGVYYIWSVDKSGEPLSPYRKIVFKNGKVVSIESIKEAMDRRFERRGWLNKAYGDPPPTRAEIDSVVVEIRKTRSKKSANDSL